jgi:hypothetical protein
MTISEDRTDITVDEELGAWIKQTLDQAVYDLMDRGAASSLVVEAKPAWVFPFQILIGKIRQQGHSEGFDWLICGDLPTDALPSHVAASPREAARHFALKWQFDAAQQGAAGDGLAERAGALYELAEEEQLWLQK